MAADIVNRKIAIDLTIKSVTVKVEEPTEVFIQWQRGTKHIDTKVREVDPSTNKANFNEKF